MNWISASRGGPATYRKLSRRTGHPSSAWQKGTVGLRQALGHPRREFGHGIADVDLATGDGALAAVQGE